MRRTDVIVIGAGQAGLAMSWHLARRGIDHVVLERGRVAERWRSERWDSLRLLSPNWCSRLPGWSYDGPDPDGFMTKPEITRYLAGYAAAFGAPVLEETTVVSVAIAGEDWRVATDHGAWCARGVVIATGHCDRPLIPVIAAGVGRAAHQMSAIDYRNPAGLPDGGVLVVGASASGVQIADELRASGRDVALAVGSHSRLPRRYRGRDIFWWLDRSGILDEPIDRTRNAEAARRQPSLQLIGDASRASIDLGTLADCGIRLIGRATAAGEGRMAFAGDLAETVGSAERRLIRLRDRIDGYILQSGEEVPDAEPFAPLSLTCGETTLDLRAEGISTVIWATGFRRRYPWLRAPALDARGEIVHRGGITPLPGLCVIGLRFLRTRKSSFIDGVAEDARALAEHMSHHLDASCRVAV